MITRGMSGLNKLCANYDRKKSTHFINKFRVIVGSFLFAIYGTVSKQLSGSTIIKNTLNNMDRLLLLFLSAENMARKQCPFINVLVFA